MALVCTCGAELPDNARFCHHCGKPQRSEDFAPSFEAAPVPAPAPLALPAAPPINFGNPVALRVALLCASLSALLNTVPFVSLGCCLWLIGAGFFAAYLYGRRAGLVLSTAEGAKLGAMTGVLTFVISIILTAINLAVIRGTGMNIAEAMRQSMEKMPRQDEITRQVIDFLTSPAGLAIFLIIYLVIGFLGMVGLAVAGGAMGAKVMQKD